MGYLDDKKNSKPDTPLAEVIFQQIEQAESKSISFADFMSLALYHPDQGYYAAPAERVIGRSGDFFTSVSVGDTFGFVLSHEIERNWVENFESAENFTIIEQGGHDGQLAIDVVTALEARRPDFFENGGRYVIVEPRESVREQLQLRFESIGLVQRINPVGSFSEARGEQGIFLANELLDAFPVHRIQFENGVWRELHVTRWNDGFAWQPVEILADSALEDEVSRLGEDFPEGYITEICLAVTEWLSEAASAFSKRGLFWIFDYGFEDDDFFASHRTTGTLQCYRNHEKSENPFERVGETDLTTHVNFSHLAREAANVGLGNYLLTDQHHFLIRASEKWLRSIDGVVPDAETAKRIRQFQTLTHPGMMGQSFKIATFAKGH